jgi:hypothetical protein
MTYCSWEQIKFRHPYNPYKSSHSTEESACSGRTYCTIASPYSIFIHAIDRDRGRAERKRKHASYCSVATYESSVDFSIRFELGIVYRNVRRIRSTSTDRVVIVCTVSVIIYGRVRCVRDSCFRPAVEVTAPLFQMFE